MRLDAEIETEDGLLLTDRASALRAVRRRLAGRDLAAELIAERRAQAAGDDANEPE